MLWGLRQTARWGDQGEIEILGTLYGKRELITEVTESMTAAALYAATSGMGVQASYVKKHGPASEG
eukprot:5711795-Lingulodinium_polyedra.AAC.1